MTTMAEESRTVGSSSRDLESRGFATLRIRLPLDETQNQSSAKDISAVYLDEILTETSIDRGWNSAFADSEINLTKQTRMTQNVYTRLHRVSDSMIPFEI